VVIFSFTVSECGCKLIFFNIFLLKKIVYARMKLINVAFNSSSETVV